MAKPYGVKTAPAKPCDSDRDSGVLVFTKIAAKLCHSGPTDAESVSDEEWYEVHYRGDEIVTGWYINIVKQRLLTHRNLRFLVPRFCFVEQVGHVDHCADWRCGS